MKNKLKNLVKKFSPRYIFKCISTSNIFQYLPRVMIHWFFILVVWIILSISIGICTILFIRYSSLEINEKQNIKSVRGLDVIELKNVLQEYENKRIKMEVLKKKARDIVDPSL